MQKAGNHPEPIALYRQGLEPNTKNEPLTFYRMWRDQTKVPDLVVWMEHYRKQLFYHHSQNYLASKERDEYLSCKLDWINTRLFYVDTDLYKSELVQIWNHSRHDRLPINKLLEQIEKCRIKHAEVQPGARAYPEMFGEKRVGDFVFVSEPRRIIKFLIMQHLLRYYNEVMEVLQKNRRTGGLRDKTEAKILRQVERGEPLNKSNHTAQVGFRWVGSKADERIKLLYSFLINREYIHKSTSPEQFRTVFSDEPVDQRVTWISTAPMLLLFIEAFIDADFLFISPELAKKRKRAKELLSARNRGELTDEQEAEYSAALHQVNSWLYARIAASFLSKKGEPHTGDTLKHARSDLYNKQKYPVAIDEFVRLAAKVAAV